MLPWQQQLHSKGYQVILASASPRRKELFGSVYPEFKIKVIETDESYPETLPANEVAAYIALNKARAFEGLVGENEIVVTSDTTVILGDIVFGKPANASEALAMLDTFNGTTHLVQTAYCIKIGTEYHSYTDNAWVTFNNLDLEELQHYIDTAQPFDKAGAYGIQDWIGQVAVKTIQGSYFTVMGLPVHALYADFKHLAATLPHLS
jgi:septum formation protein